MTRIIRDMRIIAIPLTRPNARAVLPGNTSKLNRLTYYQFQISSKKLKKATDATAVKIRDDAKTEEDSSKAKKKGWLPPGGIVNWTTNKAADIWAGFGKAKGGWKLKTFQVGEKLVDRLEFEELALKSIDPSLAPSITKLKRSPVLDEKDTTLKIPLIYPPSILSPSTALSELRAYTALRIPRHRKGFYMWMLIAPFTAPFMLIPIIPNLPFFFCAWRSWSHYRAYKSSQYLQSLLDHHLINPEPSDELDGVYKTCQISAPSSNESSTTHSTSSDDSKPRLEDASDPASTSTPKHILLLTRDSVPSILDVFGFDDNSTAAADMYRAVEQARVRVSSGKENL